MLENFLKSVAVELAKREMRAGKVASASWRVDAIACRVLTAAKDRLRFKNDAESVEMAAILAEYRNGLFGPMLIKAPEVGTRCGIWTTALKNELAEAWCDERAMFIAVNPLTANLAFGMDANYAAYLNEIAKKRIEERGLTPDPSFTLDDVILPNGLNAEAADRVKAAIAWCEVEKAKESCIDVAVNDSPYELVRAVERLICAEIAVGILNPATSVSDDEAWEYLIERLKKYLN